MSLSRSVTARTCVTFQAGVPSEGKGQPIGQPPSHQPYTFGQPDTPQGLFIRSRAGCEVYGYEEDDAYGEGEG